MIVNALEIGLSWNGREKDRNQINIVEKVANAALPVFIMCK